MTDEECIAFMQEAIEKYMAMEIWVLTSRNMREIQDCFDRMKEGIGINL